MDAGGKGFGQIALKAGLVTGAAQGVKVAVQLVSVIVLARLLEPSDFGLIAAITPIVAFIALFQDLGFQQAVIQQRDISAAQVNGIFWITAVAGAACACAVIAAAPAVAGFYGEPKLFWITVASALQLVLVSLSALPLSLLARQMRFSCLAVNDIVGTVAGFGAAAWAAYCGFGYWALVIGAAVPALSNLVMAWCTAGWKPAKPKFGMGGSLISFGANLTGFNVVNFLARNLDNVMIGKSYGSFELGYYDRAYKLFLSPLRTINAPLSRIMLPILARVQDDGARFRRMYLQVNWLLAAVTIPGVATLGMASEQAVSILFGGKWAAAAPILAWLAVAGLAEPVFNATGWLFISQGRTKTMFKWGLYSSATTVTAFIVGLPWGSVGVAAAYAISGYVLKLPVLLAVIHRMGPVKAFDVLYIQCLFLGSALLSWLICMEMDRLIEKRSEMSTLLSCGAINYGIAAFMLAAFPLSRRMFLDILRIALQRRPHHLKHATIHPASR